MLQAGFQDSDGSVTLMRGGVLRANQDLLQHTIATNRGLSLKYPIVSMHMAMLHGHRHTKTPARISLYWGNVR